MKLMLFPIGIESSTGGQYSPIFKDNTFIYIPIPEYSTQNPNHLKIIENLKHVHKTFYKHDYKLKTYDQISIDSPSEFPNYNSMGMFLKLKSYKGFPLKSYIPHYDPEFKTFTYGEGSHKKAKALSSLKEDDMIIFYMSLARPFEKKALGKFLIGYFTISVVFDYRFSGLKLNPSDINDKICNNFHIIRTDSEPIIAVGKSEKSKLFKHALQFTDNKNWEILTEILEKIIWPYNTTKVHMGIKALTGKAAELFKDFVSNYSNSDE